MDLAFYGFAVLLFAAIILAIEGAYLWWSGTRGAEAQRIARRLRLMSGAAEHGQERVSILKQRRYSSNDTLEALLRALPGSAAIDRLLLQGGLHWSVAQLAGATLVLVCAAMLVNRLWHMPLLAALLFDSAALLTPYAMLLRARAQRLRKLEELLPEATDFIARALRAGHSFSNVLQMAGAELPDPMGAELRATHEEITYGVPMNEALHNLATRIPLTDLRYLVIAVLIQRESGGNLSEILVNIGRLIRERLKLVAQVRVLSAEGRMSAWILGLLPFAVLAMMSVSNPRYISLLWTEPAGVSLLWYGAAMIVGGVLWMRNIIRIRV